MTLDIHKLEAAAIAILSADSHDYRSAVGAYLVQVNVHNILELITRLKAAENSDQHNFNRWQACEEKLREAEKDAARLEWIMKQFNMLLRLDAWSRETLDAAMKESGK